MPHVIVKSYPGRTEEQKQLLAQKIVEDVAEIFNAKEDCVSVAIYDVPKPEWKEKVWDTEIKPEMDTLYRKPAYTCE